MGSWIDPGEPAAAVAGLATDPHTLNALLGAPSDLAAAEADERATVTGSRAVVLALLASIRPS